MSRWHSTLEEPYQLECMQHVFGECTLFVYVVLEMSIAIVVHVSCVIVWVL